MDNYAQPALSPTDFFNGLDITQQPLQPGPRGYKSRKYRPCDFCRSRQVACKIDIAPPCALCNSHGKACTFVERPKKKRRPNSTSNGESSGASGERRVLSVKLLLTFVVHSSTFRSFHTPIESWFPGTIQS
jgi:hypothetical protein